MYLIFPPTFNDPALNVLPTIVAPDIVPLSWALEPVKVFAKTVDEAPMLAAVIVAARIVPPLNVVPTRDAAEIVPLSWALAPVNVVDATLEVLIPSTLIVAINVPKAALDVPCVEPT